MNILYYPDHKDNELHVELFHQELKYKNYIHTLLDRHKQEIKFYEWKLNELLKEINNK